MARLLIAFLLGGVLGGGFGFLGGLFFFPFIFPPPPAAEKITQADVVIPIVARGTFSDRIHWGRGSVTVRRDSVFLEENFEVGPGPKYHVYLMPKGNIRSGAAVKGEKFIDLGRLRSFKGSQRYAIPQGIDPTKYGSVIIWCEQFSVLISPADLKAGS
jgi:hypothetical protein